MSSQLWYQKYKQQKKTTDKLKFTKIIIIFFASEAVKQVKWQPTE